MVLGKTMNLHCSDCSITPPADCDVPLRPELKAPSPRGHFEDPSPFTLRLLEFYLARGMRDIRSPEAGGSYSENYARVLETHQKTVEYIESLPSLYRLTNPDTSFDLLFPWLSPQRYYLRSSIMLFLILLHRPYLFHDKESRKQLLLCGMDMLDAQQKFFEALQPGQYIMFPLTYLSIEPCVSILAVLISHPTENVDLFAGVFDAARLAATRLEKIRDTNVLAEPGLGTIRALLVRADAVTGILSQPYCNPQGFNLAPTSVVSQDRPFNESISNEEVNSAQATSIGARPNAWPSGQFPTSSHLSFDENAFPLSWPLQPTADLLSYASACSSTTVANMVVSEHEGLDGLSLEMSSQCEHQPSDTFDSHNFPGIFNFM